MMEHIRQFDWCPSEPDTHFILEDELDNCVTEKILRNKFYDPLVSSDSDEEIRPEINWDEILKKKNNFENSHRVFVPGLRPLPPYPKLSALTKQQHYQCLKVICADNPKVLAREFIARPTKTDLRVFEEVKETYLKEQKEYINWAKTLWSNDQCIRMLRPKPPIEMVYEAEFKIRENELQSFPKIYEMAAQIPLENKKDSFKLVHQKDLIVANVLELPQIEVFDIIDRRFTIMRPCSVPEPCSKHPCRFILPNEKSLTNLPLTEIHRELAQYALDNGAHHIASESALKCLMEVDRSWVLPLSICQTIGVDGERHNVVVLGSEFSIHRDSAQVRTYRAFKHLLEYALIPSSEKAKFLTRNGKPSRHNAGANQFSNSSENNNSMEMDSDDEGNNLFIDAAEMDMNCDESDKETENIKEYDNNKKEKAVDADVITSRSMNVCGNEIGIGVYSCTCTDSLFEKPPPRSFKKWQVRNKTTNEKYDLIVHCSHKVRGHVGEVILEPIPEYQIDMGASQQSQEKIRSLALSLCLRRNASLLNVRIDGPTGDVVMFENVYMEDFNSIHGDVTSGLADVIHTTLNQLQGLLPGSYILQHTTSHGTNAFLYATRATSGEKLILDFDISKLTETDEARIVKTPPTLIPTLLPYHKLRKILPCAFTPNEYQVAKEPKKPVTRQKTPPQAIKLDAAAERTGTRGKVRQLAILNLTVL